MGATVGLGWMLLGRGFADGRWDGIGVGGL